MILRTQEQFMKYLDCTADEVLAFMKAGLPTAEPIADLGCFSTSKLVDEWIEDQYRQSKAQPGRPVKITTTGSPVEDLRAAVERLKEGCITQPELLASLEHTIELLEGKAV